MPPHAVIPAGFIAILGQVGGHRPGSAEVGGAQQGPLAIDRIAHHIAVIPIEDMNIVEKCGIVGVLVNRHPDNPEIKGAADPGTGRILHRGQSPHKAFPINIVDLAAGFARGGRPGGAAVGGAQHHATGTGRPGVVGIDDRNAVECGVGPGHLGTPARLRRGNDREGGVAHIHHGRIGQVGDPHQAVVGNLIGNDPVEAFQPAFQGNWRLTRFVT